LSPLEDSIIRFLDGQSRYAYTPAEIASALKEDVSSPLNLLLLTFTLQRLAAYKYIRARTVGASMYYMSAKAGTRS